MVVRLLCKESVAGGASSSDLLQRGIACLLDNGSAARSRHDSAGADTSVSEEIMPLQHNGSASPL